MAPDIPRRIRQLTKALITEDLRDLAIACEVQYAASRKLPDLIDTLAKAHHDALLDRLELRINEVANDIGS